MTNDLTLYDKELFTNVKSFIIQTLVDQIHKNLSINLRRKGLVNQLRANPINNRELSLETRVPSLNH